MKVLIRREWLFFLSLFLFVVTTMGLFRFPHFTLDEFEVIFLLWTLFVTIKGFERTGFLKALAIRFERGSWVGPKLIVGTFALSIFITNDVSLVVMVPLTLMMEIEKKAWVIILEAIAANAGSLLPYSTPQNLYIYWHYDMGPWEFIEVIAPFVFSFFVVLLVAIVALGVRSSKEEFEEVHLSKKAWHFVAFFLLIVLAIFKVLPLFVAGLVLLYALFLYPEALRVDYYLLATFFLFFGISDNFQYAFAKELANPHSVFLSSVLLSQIISNVPAAIVMANFTDNWQALLWGVSVGGYGILWGSLANLIAFKFYARAYGKSGTFLAKFLALNFLALLYGIALFYIFMAS